MTLQDILDYLKQYIDKKITELNEPIKCIFDEYGVKNVSDNISNVNTVSININNVNAVGSNITNVNTVSSINADVANVSQIKDDVVNVSEIKTDVTNVSIVKDNVVTVSNNIDNLNTNANNIKDINNVSTNITSVKTVATNIDNVNITAGSITDVNTYAKTYLGPKDTEPATRNDGTALQTGDLFFDTSVGMMKVFNGSVWQLASSAVNGIRKTQTWTGDGSTTEFIVDGGYDPLYAEVYVNGVNVTTDVDLTDGTKIVFSTAPSDGDEIFGTFFGSFSIADAVLTSGDSFTIGDIEFANSNKGIILNDRSNGKKYRLYVDNGNIYTEEVI